MTFDRKIGDVDVTAQTRRGFGGGEGFKREGRKKVMDAKYAFHHEEHARDGRLVWLGMCVSLGYVAREAKHRGCAWQISCLSLGVLSGRLVFCLRRSTRTDGAAIFRRRGGWIRG